MAHEVAHEVNVTDVGMWASFCQLDTNLNISGSLN